VPASMRGQSRDALAELSARLEEALADADARAVGAELFGVVDLLDSSPALRRALTDVARPVDDRRSLLSALLGGKVSEAAASVAAEAAAMSWSRVRDLGDAIEHVAVLATVLDADRRGTLDQVEDQLHEFARAADEDSALASAFSDRAAPLDSRQGLVASLTDGRVDDAAADLIHRAVAAPRAGRVSETVADFAKVAAELRSRLVAQVLTAAPLDRAQHDRLQAALSRQYGRQVHINVDVVADLVGGLSITVGDDLIDGSMRSRITDARRALVR
jgi:F-type H+-transporting ATPase subunit delta